MAIVLTRKRGRPSLSSAYGINDPNGKPGCLRDWVERLPIRPKCINVRALSANEGSGTADWPLVEPLACFPKNEEDIPAHPLGIKDNPHLGITQCWWATLRLGCILDQRPAMKFQQFSLGQIRIDGIEYGYDVVLERASGTAQRSTAVEVPSVFGVAVAFVLRVPRIGAQRPAASRKRLAGCNH